MLKYNNLSEDDIEKEKEINYYKGYYFSCDSVNIIFPCSINDEVKNCFLRGIFEKNGSIDSDIRQCSMYYYSEIFLEEFSKIYNIPCEILNNTIVFKGVNCLDFLGKLYNNCGNLKVEEKYEQYIKILGEKMSELKVFRTDENAVIPSKTRNSDVGYDLSIIKKHKQIDKNTALYDTGIKIKLEKGYYAQIYPRSSISKSGYILSNSVGIIDPGYNSNLFIALTKVDSDTPDLNLDVPFRCCQIVIQKQLYVEVTEVTEDFEITDRNYGGFGSTG